MNANPNELHASGTPVVGILTGSPNDLPIVNKAKEVLDQLGVPSEVFAMSAHRTPDLVVTYVSGARDRGVEVIIACAGMAAHLAGVVAAHTTLPVIGVPLAAGALGGFDALLATVQMPPGIPVATVGVDASRNAGFLAARILSLRHPEVAVRLDAQMAEDRKRYTAPPAARMTPPKEAVVAAAEGEREEKKAKGGKKKKRKRKA